MKKLIALALTLCMVFALCTGFAAAADDTVTVTVQFSFPEESAQGALKVMKQMEEASGGRLKFENYFSFSFVDAADVPDALATGQLDLAGFNPAEHPAEMPLVGSMMSLPLLNFPGWTASSKILLSMLYSTPEMMQEFEDYGFMFYAGYMCPGYQFYSTKEITDLTPSAFNGLTVMCDQPEMAQFINQNKGGAISAFPPDYLTNLQNGVADALVQHVCCAFVFGCFDYVKSAVFFGEGGFYNMPLVYGMSQSFWDGLDDDIKQVFIDYADDFCYWSQMADEDLYNFAAYPALEANAEITVLDADQIAAWQEAIAPIVDAKMDEITAASPNAPEIFAKLKDMIANYDAETFEIGENNFGEEVVWAPAEWAAE